MEFERELHKKLQSLKPITKAGTIEMLYRLAKEDKIKIGDFSRKYRMHSDTAKQASDMLFEFGLLIFQNEGRKKYLKLTEKGKRIVNKINEIFSIL